MKTILVPTDFSDVAYNAATYAIEMANAIGAERLVLYHAYELVVPIPDVPTSVPMVNADDLRIASLEGLDKMKKDLEALGSGKINILTRADNTLLAATINEVCKNEEADIIVMGITGGSKLEEILVGSNTIDVAKQTTTPVLIIPEDAKFKSINKVVFACDLKKVVDTTPVDLLKKFMDAFHAELHVLNIDHDSKHFTADTPFESLMLDTLLAGYNPVYHFIDNANVVQGIISFSEGIQADLIITMPKKHGLFESIFKRSSTSKLAFKTHIPLLTIHE
ncbi:universal stress protein [Chitinophaga sp. Hz27]|uniref:universal stress protein n=1 Tax=Chitinophaga sp. Hz27 TaxID=3347169 RepID=UPI0035D5B67F